MIDIDWETVPIRLGMKRNMFSGRGSAEELSIGARVGDLDLAICLSNE